MKTPFSFIVVLGLALAGCAGADVDASREQWNSNQPSEYVIEVCGTGLAPRSCRLYAVADRHIVEAREEHLGDKGWFDADPAGQPDLVLGMFRAVEQAKSCSVRHVSFDATYGYVTDYYLDCGEEGYGQEVTCFTAGTRDLSVCGNPGR
jgi:hypothetical protein